MKVYDIQISNEMYKSPVIMVWFCGCTIHCEGCFNKHLWDFNNEKAVEYTPSKLAEKLDRIMKDTGLNTIMFSGGEPFDQKLSEIYTLIKMLPVAKFLSYTGYTLEELQEKGRTACLIIDRLSCLLSGKYNGSETGLLDKKFYGFKDDVDFFKKESLEVVVEVVISPEEAKLMGYDTLED